MSAISMQRSEGASDATLAEAKRRAFVHEALVREWQSTASSVRERLAEYARQRAATKGAGQ